MSIDRTIDQLFIKPQAGDSGTALDPAYYRQPADLPLGVGGAGADARR